MATPVVLTTGARPITPVESGGVPMTPVDTLGEPVTVVDALGEPVVLINNDGTPAFLAYSAKTYLGGVAPYHWLDFINNRALYAGIDVGNVTGATGYSFSRASQGYYTNSDGTLTLFGSGALRRGDRGVLIEGSRTNLLVRSQEFDNGSWIKSNFTVTANAIAAPDNTTTADLFTVTTTGVTFGYQDVVVSATAGSYSLFVKAGNIVNATTDFLFQDVTASAVRASCTLTWATMTVTGTGVSITALANGWYRITMASAALVSGNTMRCWISTGGSLTIAHSFYLWGAQLEAASFPSSYIPTVAAAATRASDVLTYTAGVSYPLSLWAEWEMPVVTSASALAFQVDAGSNNERTYVYWSSGNVPTFGATAASSAQADIGIGAAMTAGPAFKMAGRIATNDAQAARGGTLGTADTSVTLPTTPTTIRIGSHVSAAQGFVYIRRAAVFNSALTDAQLTTTTS
jgi:hypothetical protein